MERLQKFMSRHGIASRRVCEEIIASGKVKVNGKLINTPGYIVNPDKDKVAVDGQTLGTAEKSVYIIMNKPRGYISTASDPQGRKIVSDLLQGVMERVYPIGRLDADSEGLLLLTNDGDLTYFLTHPGHKVPKTYKVRVKGIPKQQDLEKLSSGIMLDDGITAPAKINFIEEREGNALYEITIYEGRNRQIRRMFDKIGHEVLRLRRTKIGSIFLGELKPGQFRLMREQELRSLKKIAGMHISPTRGKGQEPSPATNKFKKEISKKKRNTRNYRKQEV